MLRSLSQNVQNNIQRYQSGVVWDLITCISVDTIFLVSWLQINTFQYILILKLYVLGPLKKREIFPNPESLKCRQHSMLTQKLYKGDQLLWFCVQCGVRNKRSHGPFYCNVHFTSTPLCIHNHQVPKPGAKIRFWKPL